jgi:hypothetical protein
LAEIWRTEDRLGREVFLTEARRDHILAEHDDLVDRMDAVRTVVEEPDFVTRDADYPRRENHYRWIPRESRYIKVVVEYRPVPPQGTWAGKVITAYFSGKRKRKEALLWP